MIGAAEALALVMLGALALYAVLGGADFGGGVWDLLARGPRAPGERRLIERAMAPVWEANHVWLILVIVLLFSAFPPAFAALGMRLHAPLVLALVGIVLRGSAFVFRQYGGGGPAARRWGHVFAAASAATPLFFGLVLAAVTSGSGRWLGWFPVAVGALAVALCAYLAAVYLTGEPDGADHAEDFRRRAVRAWLAVCALAGLAALAAAAEAPDFAGRLFGRAPGQVLVAGTALCALAALLALVRRRYRLARLAAAAQVTGVVLGWGAGQYPLLIAPDIAIRAAASPPQTLRLLFPVLVIGALVVLPSLYWLLRVFKAGPGR